ncbi:MAG TPA: flagellar basal body rod C-terminal domain-containing protein [Candidatus Eremiobacteraceae bacterium]|nr:flagellar basal body rod C-terminal domain-containing protein [Candidatus Eremiobacteraceae bacterium]
MSDEAFDIAANGMEAQRAAMDGIARSIAGVGSSPSSLAQPANFQFVPASFSSALDDALAIGGPDDVGETSAGDGLAAVQTDEWAADVSAPQLSTAGERAGTGSDDDPIGAMISLISAGRAYDANVASLQAAKQMDVEASDIDKY